MLRGDLASTPLAPLMLTLAEECATGCLVITPATGADEALVWFKNGLVYAVAVPGHRPQLGAKLVSSGLLGVEALDEALVAQRTELQGWRLGELLVHLGYVDRGVVEAFVTEQVDDALWDLISWTEGTWKFRKNVKTREDVSTPTAVEELLAKLRARGSEWQNISTVLHGPHAVPTRLDGTPSDELDPDGYAMLAVIDGHRPVSELAQQLGFTVFEASLVLVRLADAGLVDFLAADAGDAPHSSAQVAQSVTEALTELLGPAEPDERDLAPELAAASVEIERARSESGVFARAKLQELAERDRSAAADPTPQRPAPDREPADLTMASARHGLPHVENREFTDTAALLRELSSLGSDDDEPGEPAPVVSQQRRPPSSTGGAGHQNGRDGKDGKRRKRGLFGL